MLKLTWTSHDDAIFGYAFRLEGLPDADCAGAHRRGPHAFVANAHVGGRFLSHTGRTFRAAIGRLEAEMDRRSIGLFGVDILQFEGTP